MKKSCKGCAAKDVSIDRLTSENAKLNMLTTQTSVAYRLLQEELRDKSSRLDTATAVPYHIVLAIKNLTSQLQQTGWWN